VVNALQDEACRCGVHILTEHRVTGIERCDHGFRIAAGTASLKAQQAVLATGGQSLPKTGSDGKGYRLAQGLGHTLVPTTPALAPLVLADDFHSTLSGVSQEVELVVSAEGWKAVRVRGPMLWTHFGISGPAPLDASRYWHRARLEGHEVSVHVNFLPDDDFVEAERKLLSLVSSQPRACLRNTLSRLIPAKVAEAVLRQLEMGGELVMAHLSKDWRRKLVHSLLAWPLPVRDSRGYGYAEVTAGGVPLHEIDPGSMASRKCPGLFLVGELLDVDGRLGGFNFQWAWSSAWVAASGIDIGPTSLPLPIHDAR
jgi:predicted Rossmann fold flavoprotein